MSSFTNKIHIPSEIITKSSSSITHTASNRIYISQSINRILSLTDNEINNRMQSQKFKSLYEDLEHFYNKNKQLRENELNHLFEEFLHDRNMDCIHDTCTYGDKVFNELFSKRKPDMSWNTTAGTKLDDFSSCPFYYKSIIELKKVDFKNKDYDQLSNYLASVLRYSPGRIFIIGCLTKFSHTSLIKVSYDEQNNDIRYEIQAMVTQAAGLQNLALFLELSDQELGYNKMFLRLLAEKRFKFLEYLGRGSSSFAFYCEYPEKSLTNIVLKISRKNLLKEKYIIQQMNAIKPDDINLINCIDLNLNETYSDYLIAFNLRGSQLHETHIRKFINNTTLLNNAWKQINLCHQVGFIHSDIRIANMILYDNYVHVIDYSSAMKVNTCDFYKGSLSTASNSVLKMLNENHFQGKISLYYSDDGVSFLKMILMFKTVFHQYTQLIKQAILEGMPYDILSTYEYAMKDLKGINLIKTIEYLEQNRQTLTIEDVNSIMIHTLENENNIDYDIDEYFEKLSLS